MDKGAAAFAVLCVWLLSGLVACTPVDTSSPAPGVTTTPVEISSVTPEPEHIATPTAWAILLFPTSTPYPTPISISTAAPAIEGEYEVQILRVLDGDTVEVGFSRVEINGKLVDELKNWSVRIEGVDTPETRSSDPFEKACGSWSRERVLGFTSADGHYVLETEFEDGGFGRILGEIRSPDGVALSEFLLDEGLAVEYDASTSRDFEDHRANCKALAEAGHIAPPRDENTPAATTAPVSDDSPPAPPVGTPIIDSGTTYKSCEDAETAGLERVKGSKGDGRGFPTELMDGPPRW